MNTVVQKTPPAFLALSIATPSAALLLSYGTHHWDEALLLLCLIFGVVLWLALLGWSVRSVRRHRARAVVGSLICAYCLWEVLHVMSKW